MIVLLGIIERRDQWLFGDDTLSLIENSKVKLLAANNIV